jgi:pantothenate kinase type III
MLLTIDVGNTHTVLGLFDGEEIVEHWRISTDARRTADELAVLLQGLMGMHPLLGMELGDGIEGISICSTVPAVLHELREVTRRYYGDVPAVLVSRAPSSARSSWPGRAASSARTPSRPCRRASSTASPARSTGSWSG